MYIRVCAYRLNTYFPKSYFTFHRFLLPISNSTCSFPHLTQADTSFFTRPRVFPGYRKKKKNYIGRVPPRSFPPYFLSFRIRRRLLLARRSFATRRGATNSGSHEFRDATRIGVEPLHIGRRFPTLRQYGQVPPVILRLFAPRRGVAALYVGTYICRRQAALTVYHDRTWPKCKKRPRDIPAEIFVGFDFHVRSPPAKRSLVIVIFRDCC